MRRLRSLATAPSLVLALVAASTLVAGCAKKPSQDQCEAFAEHFIELLQESREKPNSRIRKLAEDKHDEIVTACVSEGSVEEVECVLAQSSIGEVEANCK
ncbi:hypothetical protein G6O69_15775 [Pseudenhygromyxa sp. WMMC2535]|uniref:hypothetical protein n=1 Tax=Pseudenhygromyxa sp. WMMC2535 TaxID=2712867 RepID=UPI001556E4E6|nr:hypothetical protein [Pseudenhygromyxa sp. WMMC2535]NVB39302.1 hypothetical protein [Pseudenhygromyxa sp. WMMC2535]